MEIRYSTGAPAFRDLPFLSVPEDVTDTSATNVSHACGSVTLSNATCRPACWSTGLSVARVASSHPNVDRPRSNTEYLSLLVFMAPPIEGGQDHLRAHASQART